MNELITTVNNYLGPALSGTLGQALVGLTILIVGLFVVKIVCGIIARVLGKVGMLRRQNEDGSVTDLVAPIMTLIKAVLTILVLMAVLQHFGLTDVLVPLEEMVSKFAAAVPNVIGAGVIAYAGWVLATIVADLSKLGLRKVDQQIAERTGNGDIQVAGFGSAFIFGGVLLPIVVSALGVLNIPAISDPASEMIRKLMGAVPNIVGAGIILLVAYLVTRFVIYMITGLLEGANINALPQKLGIEGLFSDTFTPTRLVGSGIMLFSMMAAATAAVNVLGIDVISRVFAGVLEFGGGLLVGGLILIIGNFLSNLAHERITAGGNSGLANIARIAILGLVLAMGLRSMGLADNIVNMAFGLTIGSVAVATALAFGLGGRDAAKAIADTWASRIHQS